MSYSGNPAASDIDMVRFLLGDTDPCNEMLTDEEIQAMLDQCNGNVYAAASACAWALSGKYARQADRSVGDLSISYSQLAKNFRDLGRNLDNQGATSSEGFRPYCGGISVADKQSQEADPDRVPPIFTRDIHDDQSDQTTRSTTG